MSWRITRSQLGEVRQCSVWTLFILSNESRSAVFSLPHHCFCLSTLCSTVPLCVDVSLFYNAAPGPFGFVCHYICEKNTVLLEPWPLPTLAPLLPTSMKQTSQPKSESHVPACLLSFLQHVLRRGSLNCQIYIPLLSQLPLVLPLTRLQWTAVSNVISIVFVIVGMN